MANDSLKARFDCVRSVLHFLVSTSFYFSFSIFHFLFDIFIDRFFSNKKS